MDIQSVLEATFPPPTIEPGWQSDLLLRLEAIAATSTHRTCTRGISLPPQIELHGSALAAALGSASVEI
jgi:hypothetical protein